MKKTIVSLTALAALVLSGCSSKTFCEDQTEVFDDVMADKLKDCPNMKAMMSVSAPISGQACEDAYDKCTDNDRTKLEEAVECERNVAACTAETENTTWLASIMGCLSKVCQASNPCVTAMKMDGLCTQVLK